MKFYLSSFKLGNSSRQLVMMMAPAKNIGYIPNACDYTNVDVKRRSEGNASDMAELSALGLDVQLLDLRDYFGKTEKLREKISELGALFFRGGNTYILR